MALVTGVMGLAMSAFGCMFGPFMFVGAMMSLVAITVGFVEYRNIQSGASGKNNQPFAVVGMATGGSGCALGCLYGLFIGLFLGLYVAFFLFLIVAGAAGGH